MQPHVDKVCDQRKDEYPKDHIHPLLESIRFFEGAKVRKLPQREFQLVEGGLVLDDIIVSTVFNGVRSDLDPVLPRKKNDGKVGKPGFELGEDLDAVHCVRLDAIELVS